MRAERQNGIGGEIGEIIEATLADYTPPTTDLKVAAINFLKYGMLGCNIRVEDIQVGFCDNQNLRQMPGAVPKEDLPDIMKKLYTVLLKRGHNTYAKAVEPYRDGDFLTFNPGSFAPNSG